MARPLRIEYPGAFYHITSRGNAKMPFFDDDEDRECFIGILEDVVKRFNWVVHAYCMMDNHYHLLVETMDGILSKGMRHVNGVYTQCLNRRHDRVGHIFQGRFKSILVNRESHLLELCRYVVLNPVRAGMAKQTDQYRWSSYRATAGLEGKRDYSLRASQNRTCEFPSSGSSNRLTVPQVIDPTVTNPSLFWI